MNGLFDALLNRPIAEIIVRLLLFTLFTLHFLFVLFTIGTAIQSVYYFIRYRWSRVARGQGGDQRPEPVQAPGAADRPASDQAALAVPTTLADAPAVAAASQVKEFAWGKQILHSFLGVKSLAVALGVGALLLIELGLTVPFFTAINLLAPYWLLIILFLIIAFLTLDLIGQNWEMRPYLRLGMGIVGLLFLLAVPGIFVAALVTMEHPEAWQAVINNNYKLPSFLSLHWLLRYGHVIGAALVFGGAFHYFFSKADQKQKRAEMLRWVVAGILAQFTLGILLYFSLPTRPELFVNLLIALAIASASVLLWMVAFRRSLPLRAAVLLLLLVLLPMLLTRQALQDKALLPLNAQLEQNAAVYQGVLAKYSPQGLQAYQADLTNNYASGEAIYSQSCSFCHGPQANGQGQEAGKLTVPPEILVAVRADRSYLDHVLRNGVPGSAMPYFTFMTSGQVDNLFAFLNNQYKILHKPQPLANPIPQSGVKTANEMFNGVCSICHGKDGRGGTFVSANYAPPPPDLTRYSLTPQRAFDVITYGYPGTFMSSYNHLPEDVRWGLVQVLYNLRK